VAATQHDEDLIALDEDELEPVEEISAVEPAPIAEPEIQPHPADSPLERLRQAAESRAQDKSLLLPVPGWSDELLFRFKILSEKDSRRLRSAARGGNTDVTKAIITVLTGACTGLYVLDKDGNPEPLIVKGEEAGLKDVGAFMPRKVQSAKQGLVALLQEGDPPILNQTALQALAETVGAWMANTSMLVEGAVEFTINDDGRLIDESPAPGS
jgi:hypothetical protein